MLDRDTPPTSYSFTLVAVDSLDPTLFSEATVTYNVLDANDNPPVFEQPNYTFHIQEQVPMGTRVGDVAAMDLDIGDNGRLSTTLRGMQSLASRCILEN